MSKVPASYLLGAREWKIQYDSMDLDSKIVFLNMPLKNLRKFIKPFIESRIEEYFYIVEAFSRKDYTQGVFQTAKMLKKEV